MIKTFFLRIWCALALAASPILLVGCEKSSEERSRGGSSADPKVPDPAELPSVPDPAELPSVPDPAELPSVPDPAELPSVPDPAELPSVPDPAELPNE